MRPLTIILASLIIPLAAFSQPRLEVVGGTSLSLDTLYRGDIVERTLSIRNTGKAPLLLGDIVPSCGCTGTVVSSDRIAPGETGSLKITFNTKSFSGPVHKSITIQSNDPASPATVVTFTAYVLQELVVTPQQFWFKDAEVGRTTTVTLTLRNSSKTPLSIKGFRTALDGLKIIYPKAEVKPGTEAVLKAEYTPPAAIPVIAESVFLQTDNPRQPELYIPVFGNAKEFRFE